MCVFVRGFYFKTLQGPCSTLFSPLHWKDINLLAFDIQIARCSFFSYPRMNLHCYNSTPSSSSGLERAGNLMSSGFVLQEQKGGMCCCLGGLCGLFSGLVKSCTLQPQDPSSCWVQFICACTAGASWASCINFAFPGSLCNCLLDCILMFPNHLAEDWYLPSNLCCQRGSSSFNLLLSVEICQGSFCSWQAAPGCCFPGNTFFYGMITAR